MSNMPDIIEEDINMKLRLIENTLEGVLVSLPVSNGNDSVQIPDTHSWLLGSEGSEAHPSSTQSMRTLADDLEQAVGRTWQDKAVGTEGSTRQDKAVSTTSVTWQDKAVGTADTCIQQGKAVSTTSVIQKAGGVAAVLAEHLPKAGAVAECLRRAMAEHLPKAGVVAVCLWKAMAEHLPKAGVVAECLRKAMAEHLPKAAAVAECLRSAVAECLWNVVAEHITHMLVAIAINFTIFYVLCTYTLQEDIVHVY
jgi:hypothetical protein